MYDVFQQLMDVHGVNRADVSRATGISQSTLSNWRKRGGSLSAENAKLIADYFGVTIEFLLTGEGLEVHNVVSEDANSDIRELAVFLFDHPEYKVLFDACQKVKRDDIRFVQKIIERVSR